MKRMMAAMAVAGLVAGVAGAALPPGLAEESRAAIERGAEWLAGLQQEDGHWDMAETPALTALSVWALQKADAEKYGEAIRNGVAFILRNVQPDGSIWHRPSPGERGGGLANYNTAVCVSALHQLGWPELAKTIQAARTYLAGTQYGEAAGLFKGGIGYSPDEPRAHADLSNSHMVYEAMRLTQDVEDLRAEGEARADLDWDAALEFLSQVQNLPGVNTNAWVSGAEEDRGGFIYRPAAVGGNAVGGRGAGGAGGAGTMERRELLERGVAVGGEGRGGFGYVPRPAAGNAGEAVVVHPYGSMTYAGILSLIYAKVDAGDPRLEAAREWAKRHWTLEENPGMGSEGLYYFFNTLTKCLAAMGDETVATEDGTEVPWREAVAAKLVSLQAEDGSWCNDNNRWWEADPCLVTAYTLIALATAAE